MSFLEKANTNIGGDVTSKSNTTTDTDSGTETGDGGKSTPAANHKGNRTPNPGRANGPTAKKDGSTPGPRRRGQGRSTPGSAGSTDKSSDPGTNRADSALSSKAGTPAPGTPTPDRVSTPGMQQIKEEGGHAKTNGTPVPDNTGDKSPRPASTTKGVLKKV